MDSHSRILWLFLVFQQRFNWKYRDGTPFRVVNPVALKRGPTSFNHVQYKVLAFPRMIFNNKPFKKARKARILRKMNFQKSTQSEFTNKLINVGKLTGYQLYSVRKMVFPSQHENIMFWIRITLQTDRSLV